MATITPGAGATCVAPTIEGQLFQLLHFINLAETTLGFYNKFSLSKGESNNLESSFTLDGGFSFNPETNIFADSAAPYLIGTIFTEGTGGTIKGTHLAEYFINACKYAIFLQRNAVKNPQKLTGVALDFDYAIAQYTGKITLPYTTVITSAGITEVATEWLL